MAQHVFKYSNEVHVLDNIPALSSDLVDLRDTTYLLNLNALWLYGNRWCDHLFY